MSAYGAASDTADSRHSLHASDCDVVLGCRCEVGGSRVPFNQSSGLILTDGPRKGAHDPWIPALDGASELTALATRLVQGAGNVCEEVAALGCLALRMNAALASVPLALIAWIVLRGWENLRVTVLFIGGVAQLLADGQSAYVFGFWITFTGVTTQPRLLVKSLKWLKTSGLDLDGRIYALWITTMKAVADALMVWRCYPACDLSVTMKKTAGRSGFDSRRRHLRNSATF